MNEMQLQNLLFNSAQVPKNMHSEAWQCTSKWSQFTTCRHRNPWSTAPSERL